MLKQSPNKLGILLNYIHHMSLFDYWQSKKTHMQKHTAYYTNNTQLYNWDN